MYYPTCSRWLDRCIGRWDSHRRYLYFSTVTGSATAQMVSTSFEIFKPTPESWTIAWDSHAADTEGNPLSAQNVSKGEMTVKLRIRTDSWDTTEVYLERDRGYFTDEATDSTLHMLDADTMVFHTIYGGARYREEIRLLNDDQLRLRQTTGNSIHDNTLKIVGQYTEVRVRG